eukprot:12483660-Heterocapsa_arctica.AAC.1
MHDRSQVPRCRVERVRMQLALREGYTTESDKPVAKMATGMVNDDANDVVNGYANDDATYAGPKKHTPPPPQPQ